MLDGAIFRFTYPQPWKLSMCTAVSSDSGGLSGLGIVRGSGCVDGEDHYTRTLPGYVQQPA